MKKMKTVLLCVFLCILGVCLPACQAGGLPSTANAALTYRLSDEPVTLDPQIAADTNAMITIEALFEGLTRLDADNEPIPGAAESWSSNTDHTVFTFQLRENAVWSNGDPVTAQDFLYAFQRALDPATGSTTCEPMYCIKNAEQIRAGTLPVSELGVSAQGDFTLIVELEYPYEEFPALTATTPFMPCHEEFFLSCEGQYGLDARYVLGNGPFTMASRYAWEHGESISLTRSETYQGEDAVYPSSLTLSIGSLEEGKSLQALLDGTTCAASITVGELAAAEEAGCKITSFQDTTWGLVFNTSSESLKDEVIRKAFIQTLDREKLLEYLPEETIAASDILSPSTVFHGSNYRQLAGSGFFLPQDASAFANAQSFLSSQEQQNMPSITVLCPDDEAVKRMVNEMLIAWNETMGQYFNMEPLSRTELERRVSSGNYDMALYPLQASGEEPQQVLSLFTSGREDNPAHLQSAEYDALLSSLHTLSSEEMLARLVSAEKYLNDHAVFYPLYYESHYYATAPGIIGVIFHPYGRGIDFIRAGEE